MPSKTKNKANTIKALRVMDTRRICDRDELMRIAKLVNVKAEIHKQGIALRKIERSIYQDLRTVAVSNLIHRGGGTVEELCQEITNLIRSGSCGLGRRTFATSGRRNRNLSSRWL